MIKISKVTRYTIPIEGGSMSLNRDGDTTAWDLYEALGELPGAAKITTAFGQIYATFYHDDIEVN